MDSELVKGFSFGDFILDPSQRRLLRNGEPVPLKAKAFDLLVALAENRGRVLTKAELLDKVWENQFVEENNLTVHIAALRKALGETGSNPQHIVTIPGKGYRFVAKENEPEKEVIVESVKIERYLIEETVERREGFSLRPLMYALPVVLIAAAAYFAYSYNAGTEAAAKPAAVESFPTGGVPHRVAISPDGRTLAYIRRLRGKDSIWLGNIAAKTSIQVTPDSIRLHESIEFSPDGEALYFIARDENHSERTLMKVPIYGGAPRVLAERVRSVSASPNGGLAYLKYDGPQSLALYIANADAGHERLIYQPVAPASFANFGISWTPDGTSVTAAISGPDGAGCDFVNVSPSDGSTVSTGPGLCADTTNFAWLKDGSGIVMASREAPQSPPQVLFANLAQGTRRPLTTDSVAFGPYSVSTAVDGRVAVLQQKSVPSVTIKPMNSESESRRILHGSGNVEGNHGLAVAPDGRLVYTVRGSNLSSIWDVNLDGSAPRELITAPGDVDNIHVGVTPDNRYIVFESNRSGKREIWRTLRDGTNPVVLTSGGDNLAPTLMPDGQTVVYMAIRDGVYDIWSVSIHGGKPVRLTSTGCSWPDVSPDGSEFACATGTAADGPKRLLAVYPIAGGKPRREFKVAANSALYNRLRWAPDGRSIIYKDTVDGLWQQNLTGGDPVKLPGFEDERVYHFTFGPGGELIYSGGVQMRTIAILNVGN